MKGKVKINFDDQESRRILTKCCLDNDFNLDVELPKDRLSPTIPLRLNYIHFIEDVMLHCGITENISGVDIGCGSSCVYCLIALRLNPLWKMFALELDELNLKVARENVNRNKLQEQIIIVDQESSEKIFKQLFEKDQDKKTFCLCNPPFYASEHEMTEIDNRTGKRRKLQIEQPSKETVVEGGEVAFITKIINESLELRDKIQIFSTMVGCKRNFEQLLDVIKQKDIKNFITTKFIQGKVIRWCIAWSFSCENLHLFKDHHHQKTASEKSAHILKYIVDSNDLIDISTKTKDILRNFKIEIKAVEEKEDHFKYELHAKENTWTNQRRKRRAETRNEELIFSPSSTQETPNQDLSMGLEVQRNEEDDKVCIKMYYVSGSMNKDCVNQILQQIKNRLK